MKVLTKGAPKFLSEVRDINTKSHPVLSFTSTSITKSGKSFEIFGHISHKFEIKGNRETVFILSIRVYCTT